MNAQSANKHVKRDLKRDSRREFSALENARYRISQQDTARFYSPCVCLTRKHVYNTKNAPVGAVSFEHDLIKNQVVLGYLAHKKLPPAQDHHRSIGTGLL